MAVPSAVTRRKEQDAAALRGAGINPESGAPLEVQLPAAPAPDPAPTFQFSSPTPAPTATPTDDAATLKAKVAELEQQLSTQNGRASSSTTELEEANRRLTLLENNRQFLENNLQQLTEQAAELQAKNEELAKAQSTAGVSKVLKDLEGVEITAAEQEEFAQSGPFIQKVVKQTMAATLKPLIEQISALQAAVGKVDQIGKTLPGLEKSVQAAQSQAQRAAENQFMQREVFAHFPDFPKTKETPEWKRYMHTDIPGRGIKVGQLLITYQQMNNATGIRAVLQNFYDQLEKRPTLNSLAVPAKTSGDVPLTPESPKLKASEYKQKLSDFTMKKISRADWDEYKGRWEAAFAAGNVEFDAQVN